MLSTPEDDDQTVEHLRRDGEALITFTWDERFLTPALRWVQAISAGVEQFPLEGLVENGVVLTSAKGAHTPSVAEHAIAMLLALVRGLGRAVRRAGKRRWHPEMATEVGGRTATVVGMGSIGSAIARRLHGLDVRVIGVRGRPELDSDSAETVVGPDEIVSACAQSDILVCALPGTTETRGFIGAAEIDALGHGWVVNVGRGQVIDEDALVSALKDGRLAGAGLDVTATEPLPGDSPLWDLDNVIVTPHMAWASDRLTPRLVDLIERNVRAFFGEGSWTNRVV